MQWMNWIKMRRLASLGLAVALACPIAAVAQESGQGRESNNNDSQNEESAEDSQRTDEETAENEKARDEKSQTQRQLRVFELKHRRPGDIRQLLSLRFDPQEERYTGAVRPGAATTVAYGEDLLDELAIATDDEKQLVFVRGDQQKIQKLEKLIQAVDVPASELKEQSLGGMHVIPLQEDHARDIDRILADLELDTRSVLMEDVRLLIVPTGDSEKRTQNLQQVKEVVSRLKSRGGEADADDEARDNESDQDQEDQTRPQDRTAQSDN